MKAKTELWIWRTAAVLFILMTTAVAITLNVGPVEVSDDAYNYFASTSGGSTEELGKIISSTLEADYQKHIQDTQQDPAVNSAFQYMCENAKTISEKKAAIFAVTQTNPKFYSNYK